MSAAVALDERVRERLHETFAALCRIESPTGRERACADWLTAELAAMGLTVEEDRAGASAGSDAGNLLVRIPGRCERSILLCAHMDTVPLTAPVEPVLRDGAWQNANHGILGADNKAAVAALVELARELSGAAEPETDAERTGGGEHQAQVGVELLFTVCEETGLRGASAFDLTRLSSRIGYVFDHASPIGEVIVASPALMRLEAEVRGHAAHAGLEPERGRSAILAAARAVASVPQGRLDPETTANVGVIGGGSATNVVPERCRIEAEIRSVDGDRLDTVLTATIDAIQDAVDGCGCDVDLQVQRLFSGYRLRGSDPALQLAERALRSLGREPVRISTGGGADANAFRARGLACVNLANGTERAHQPTERVGSGALEEGLALCRALVREAGGHSEEVR